MIRTLLAVFTAALAVVAVAHGVTSERYTLTVGHQSAGGDPGVLYVGGPANFRVVDREGERPLRILGAAAIAEGRGAAVVVRLNRALPAGGQARPPLMLGRAIVRNEVLPRGQRFYGGTTPTRVGRRGRHCYAAEAQQVVPRSALKPGSTFVAAIRRDRRVVAARAVTVRRGADGFDPAFLRRAGC